MIPLLCGAQWKANSFQVFETLSSFFNSFLTESLRKKKKSSCINVHVMNLKQYLEIYLLNFLALYLLDTAQNNTLLIC